MLASSDAIRVLEEAYRYERADDQWLQGVVDALRPLLDRGLGLMGACYDASEPARLRVLTVCGAGCSEETIQAIMGLPVAADPAVVETIFRTKVYATSGEKIRERHGAEFAQITGGFTQTTGVVDILDLNAQNPDARGCIFSAPLARPARLRRAEIARAERVAAHISAGLRIRQHLGRSSQPEVGAEAILRPDGRLDYAAAPAQSSSARSALRDAAIAIDRARGKLRHTDPDQALELWRSLVAGRWTLFDQLESDGRRIVIARRNDPAAIGADAVPLRTRQVLAYRALGHSLKVIAYELGISAATVSRELARGMASLGIRSMAELRVGQTPFDGSNSFGHGGGSVGPEKI